jgi:integrase
MLYDPKGKRSTPRPHELPITPAAKTLLEPCLATAAKLKSDWIFTTIGTASTTPFTLTAAAREIAIVMLAAGEAREPFSLRDVRRTWRPRWRAWASHKTCAHNCSRTDYLASSTSTTTATITAPKNALR